MKQSTAQHVIPSALRKCAVWSCVALAAFFPALLLAAPDTPTPDRSTRYGVGYEFRMQQLERSEKDSAERPERPDMPDSAERPERPERPATIDRPMRPDRPERVERPERPERP